MSNPKVEMAAAFDRVAALTWRGVQLSLLVAGLCVSGFAIRAYGRSIDWTGTLAGLIVLLTAFQLHLGQGQFARLTPARPRAWLRPLAYVLYLLGTAMFAAGARAAVHLLAAP